MNTITITVKTCDDNFKEIVELPLDITIGDLLDAATEKA
jgi:hypothetical protein